MQAAFAIAMIVLILIIKYGIELFINKTSDKISNNLKEKKNEMNKGQQENLADRFK